MVSRQCLAHFLFHARRRRFKFGLQIGSVATYRIVSFHGEGFSVSCYNMHFVWLQVGRSTPTHRGLCFVNAQHLVCLQLSLNFVCPLFVLCVWWCVQGKPTEHLSSMRMRFCVGLQTATDSWTDDVKEHNDVTITSRIRPRLVRKRFTTRQFAHRNRVTYRKSASFGAVEHKTPHSHLYTCERFVSRDSSCGPSPKLFVCLCQLGAIPPVDISHLQICFLFAMVHLASRSRSMGDLQT